MTHLAAAVFVQSLDQALADASRAAEMGADLVEYRIDQVSVDSQILTQLVERSALPSIITCRCRAEGGLYDGDEVSRLALLEQATAGSRKPAYVDVELDAYQDCQPLKSGVAQLVDHPGQVDSTTTGLILSSHDFTERPVDLCQRIEAMLAAPACRVIKIAWRARSLRDNLEAFEIIAQRHKPTIALCMGAWGLPSRVLAKKFGALLTYATVDRDAGTAPGQPTIEELKHQYRWDALNPQTSVFGVIGDPVGHSMSPAVHNAGFDAVGFDGVYLPLPIPAEYEHFKATVDAWVQMPQLGFRGASVTIPHKQNLLRFADEFGARIDPLARQIGAANTLIVRRDDQNLQLQVTNTDYDGSLDSVCAGLGIGRKALKDRRVAVIGAGGIAAAVVAGFAHYGATVVIYNRTFTKAVALAERFAEAAGKVVPARLETLCKSCCQIYVNCTSVGMHPNTDDTPIATTQMKGWRPDTLVFDTVYNPLHTRLLREAAEAGCLVVPGQELFVRQAATQFKLWTGLDPPLDVFRDILSVRLGS